MVTFFLSFIPLLTIDVVLNSSEPWPWCLPFSYALDWMADKLESSKSSSTWEIVFTTCDWFFYLTSFFKNLNLSKSGSESLSLDEVICLLDFLLTFEVAALLFFFRRSMLEEEEEEPCFFFCYFLFLLYLPGFFLNPSLEEEEERDEDLLPLSDSDWSFLRFFFFLFLCSIASRSSELAVCCISYLFSFWESPESLVLPAKQPPPPPPCFWFFYFSSSFCTPHMNSAEKNLLIPEGDSGSSYFCYCFGVLLNLLLIIFCSSSFSFCSLFISWSQACCAFCLGVSFSACGVAVCDCVFLKDSCWS